MRCTKCGAELTPGHRFCCNCGSSVGVTEVNKASSPAKGMGLPVAGAVLVILGTLGGGAAGKAVEIQTRIGGDPHGGYSGIVIAVLLLVAGMICSAMSLMTRQGEAQIMSIVSLLWGVVILLTWAIGVIMA